MPSVPARSLLTVVLALLATLALGACGEKEEPSLAEIDQQAEPLPLGDLVAALDQRGVDRPGPLTGSWQGTLRQQGLKPFQVRVRIASLSDPKANVVHYGEIDCTGSWRFLSGAGSSVRFLEVIDRGAGGKCKGKGTVTLTSVASGPDQLRYAFRDAKVESQGILNRRGR